MPDHEKRNLMAFSAGVGGFLGAAIILVASIPLDENTMLKGFAAIGGAVVGGFMGYVTAWNATSEEGEGA